MDSDFLSQAEGRLSSLERNDGTQDRQISELFGRVNDLERQQAAQGATLTGMQTNISEAKTAAQAASDKLDALKTWMLGITATSAVTLILLLIQLAFKKP